MNYIIAILLLVSWMSSRNDLCQLVAYIPWRDQTPRESTVSFVCYKTRQYCKLGNYQGILPVWGNTVKLKLWHEIPVLLEVSAPVRLKNLHCFRFAERTRSNLHRGIRFLSYENLFLFGLQNLNCFLSEYNRPLTHNSCFCSLCKFKFRAKGSFLTFFDTRKANPEIIYQNEISKVKKEVLMLGSLLPRSNTIN